MVDVGHRPLLTYIRCHREPRRQILLQSRVKAEWEKPSMVHVVRVAIQMAKDGSIPGVGDHGRTKDFLKRCSEALQALEPSEESVFTKLPPSEQQAIRQALGGTKPVWEGCFNCLEDKPEWVVQNMLPLSSQCGNCGTFQAFGRTVNSLRDILAPSRMRERGRVSDASLRTLKPYGP